MLLAILSICSPDELDEADSDTDVQSGVRVNPDDLAARKQQIKNKILAVGKMQKVFQALRCVLILTCYLPSRGYYSELW